MSSASKEPLPCRAVILAAGKGTRMKSDLPKVVMPLAGRAMILHVMSALSQAGIRSGTVIVGYRKDIVANVLAEVKPEDFAIEYAEQTEQLGTGHAFLMSEASLRDYAGPIMVTNGDMPMLRADTLKALVQEHLRSGNAATVLSAELDEPTGYGRLVRDEQGRLTHIVEEKDAGDAERAIHEVNSGTYVFNAPDVFDVIRKIGTNNKQNEYYLPDVVSLYRQAGAEVGSLVVADPTEALGANSQADLQVLEDRYGVRA